MMTRVRIAAYGRDLHFAPFALCAEATPFLPNNADAKVRDDGPAPGSDRNGKCRSKRPRPGTLIQGRLPSHRSALQVANSEVHDPPATARVGS